jgi:hypothetical protein
VRTTFLGMLVGVLGLASLSRADEIQLTDMLPGTFVDITGIGTNLHLGNEGYAEITTTIGNALLPAGPVVISNNGGMGFDPPSPILAPDNEPIPSAGAFGGGQSLLAYWDDIGNDVGGVYYYEGNNVLIVEWFNRQIGEGRPRITFEVQIFDASEVTNPYFQFLYQDVSGAGGGASATIGYQDGGAGFNDDQWSYDTPGAVVDGGVLSVLPEPSSALLVAAMLLCRRRAAMFCCERRMR